MRRESHVRICEGLRGQFLRPTRRSIYVKSKRAGDRVMESISKYIEKELKLKVNVEKSIVTRPWRTRSIFSTLDEWMRSRVRLCYWNQWKRVKTRVRELKKLGVTSNQAYQWGNTRKGPWRTVNSPILKRTLTTAFLKKEGLLYLTDIIAPKTVNV
ncbi:hypothetical protein EDC17_10352 [Sphingobacterium alimentarium]|uniref:Group II intron maturase-specific domain-containing protein n=1 Tax=Sphingobacterium alimentarium TaxID=797292 RepID=A0A4R3VU41_9SPHI|nr:group II intron maturase-specific domain-containing protein [Sphingobacterium alimentarium]TCV10236.1 hypothetical protein EDC17_10352 [Sphingobacterium alimentarium]